MSSRINRFILLLAIAVMPLQGIAATLSVLICHGEAEAHAVHAQEGHDHGAHDQGHHDDSAASGDLTYHLCCHHTLSGVPVLALPPALPEFPLFAMAPQPLYDLFFPDRPQRPPLA